MAAALQKTVLWASGLPPHGTYAKKSPILRESGILYLIKANQNL